MKLKIIIKGKVHGVGYRVKLINMALEYGIDKFSVFNVEIDGKQAVICLVEAPDDIIEIIRERIKVEKPEKAVVESISFEDYRYEIPPIERCMQAFQMEHWGKAIPILLDMRDRQDETLKEIKEVKEIIKKESEKTRVELGAKIDSVKVTVKEESEKTRVELKGEIKSVKEELVNLRLDLKEYMESNLSKMREEIAEIREALKRAGIM